MIKGVVIYKHDSEGKEILSDVGVQEVSIDPVTGKEFAYTAEAKERLIDDDMPTVVKAYKKWVSEYYEG